MDKPIEKCSCDEVRHLRRALRMIASLRGDMSLTIAEVAMHGNALARQALALDDPSGAYLGVTRLPDSVIRAGDDEDVRT